MFVKSKFLVLLINKFNNCAEDNPVRLAILKILTAVACVKDMKAVRKEGSPAHGGVSGV